MNSRILELALEALEMRKAQLNTEIEALRAEIGSTVPPKKAQGKKVEKKAPRKMSAAARKAVSARMKAYWAKKRAEKAKK